VRKGRGRPDRLVAYRQGALTGKYLPGAAPPAGSRATDSAGSRFIAEYLTDDILGRVQQLRPVAEAAGLTFSQLAVAWTLQNPNVSAAIVGASRPEQVRENVRACGIRLDPAVLARIDDVLGPVIVRDPAQTASPAARP
jgi:aryl-alcohol dehydrogenase-like predicted oxidoreductase